MSNNIYTASNFEPSVGKGPEGRISLSKRFDYIDNILDITEREINALDSLIAKI